MSFLLSALALKSGAGGWGHYAHDEAALNFTVTLLDIDIRHTVLGKGELQSGIIDVDQCGCTGCWEDLQDLV